MYYLSCTTPVLEQPIKLSYKKKLALFPLSSVNFYGLLQSYIWVKIFKNGPSTICWTQPLKNLKWYGLPKAIIHKFYLVHSWILCPICNAVVPCFVFFSYHKVKENIKYITFLCAFQIMAFKQKKSQHWKTLKMLYNMTMFRNFFLYLLVMTS